MTWPGNDHGTGWQGTPQHGPPAPRPSSGVSPVMAATLALVFVVVVIIAGAVVVNTFRDSGAAASDDQSSSAPRPNPSKEASEEPSEEPSPTKTKDLLNPDWQRAKSAKWGFTYEVPGHDEGWSFEGPQAMYGVAPDENDIPELAMSGVSYYETSPCDSSASLAVAGAQGISDTEDTADMAEGVARRWAELAYETDGGAPEVTLRSIDDFAANGLEGHYGIADATPVAIEDECTPEGGEVHTVVVPDREEDNEVRAFSIIADTGYDDSLDADTIETILDSLRDSVEAD